MERFKATSVASHVDQDRLWARHMDMAEIGRTPAGGINRLAFSPEEAHARRSLIGWARSRGFACHIDDLGNIFVRRGGKDPEAAPVLSGSHLDSQPNGGRFDGTYGVLAAFEALEAMEDAGVTTRRPVEAVVWSAEEGGSRFTTGCLGSQVFADPSKLSAFLDKEDSAGVSLRAAVAEMKRSLPELPPRKLKSPVAYFVEAHIEQGPVLEEQGETIGVVTGIQGGRWFTVEVTGEPAHAGNTAAKRRKDALVAAVRMMARLQELFHDPDDLVRFTIGKLAIQPNAAQVVPGQAMFTIDFRHPDSGTLDRLGNQVEALCRASAGPCDVKVTETRRAASVRFDGPVSEAITDAVRQLGYSYSQILSGAGHDARYLAEICPTGMIFVPCWRGISHNEREDAKPTDLAAGTRVLAETLLALANRPD